MALRIDWVQRSLPWDVRWEAVGHGQEMLFDIFAAERAIKPELQPRGSGAGSKSQVFTEEASTGIPEPVLAVIFHDSLCRAVSPRDLGEAS